MNANELKQLIGATGLPLVRISEMLDTDYRSLCRWISGEREPRHPAMLKKALQLIALEQHGLITERLIEQTTKRNK